jgi:N4-gp56 family major capsid protein
MGTVISTATTNFNQTVVTLVNKRLEELLRAPLPHLLPDNFRQATFVKGTNSTMRFINIADMSVVAGTVSAGTPPWLTEGVAPASEDLAVGYEEFSASQAGRVIKLTDLAMMESPFDLMAEAADRVARNAIATADKRVAEVLVTGTNAVYGSGSSNATVNPHSSLTGALVKQAVAKLAEGNGVNGQGGVPTFADGSYHGIIRPGAKFDLMSDTAVGGWIDAARYAGSKPLMVGELGEYAGVRFVESPAAVQSAGVVGPVIASGATAYIATTDVFTITTDIGLVTGDRIKVTSITGGAPLAAGTTYYVIKLTGTTFKIATTLANARAGTAIDITTDSSAQVTNFVSDINSTIILGPDAYAFGDWGSIQTYFTAPGGTIDPLHQLAQVGWKGMFGATIMGEGANANGVTAPRYVRIVTTAPIL